MVFIFEKEKIVTLTGAHIHIYFDVLEWVLQSQETSIKLNQTKRGYMKHLCYMDHIAKLPFILVEHMPSYHLQVGLRMMEKTTLQKMEEGQ